MSLRIVTLFLFFQLSLFANNCPKWAPIAVDDIFTVIPIYPYSTTAADMDCDGVSDSIERQQGTNPNKRDTDGDGVGDYEDDYPLNPHKSVDKTAPIITLKGKTTVVLYRYNTYKEAGATAKDDRDGTVPVHITGKVNTAVPKTYRITYTATDKRGNRVIKYRSVIVKAEIRPQITIDRYSPVDATGSRPSNVVQAFIKAYLSNDKKRVSALVGGDKRILHILYGDTGATAFLKRIYKNTYKIEGKSQKMGDSSVTITFRDNNGAHKGGFELMKSGENKWIIRMLY